MWSDFKLSHFYPSYLTHLVEELNKIPHQCQIVISRPIQQETAIWEQNTKLTPPKGPVGGGHSWLGLRHRPWNVRRNVRRCHVSLSLSLQPTKKVAPISPKLIISNFQNMQWILLTAAAISTCLSWICSWILVSGEMNDENSSNDAVFIPIFYIFNTSPY